MISLLEKLVDRLVRFELFISALLALVLGILVFVSAMMRYLLGSPLYFSDELVALLFVSACFLCLPYSTRCGLHIKLDIFTKRLPQQLQPIIEALATIAGIVIITVFATSAIEEVLFSIEIDEVSEVAEILIYPFKVIMMVSLYSAVIAMVTNLFCKKLTSDLI